MSDFKKENSTAKLKQAADNYDYYDYM